MEASMTISEMTSTPSLPSTLPSTSAFITSPWWSLMPFLFLTIFSLLLFLLKPSLSDKSSLTRVWAGALRRETRNLAMPLSLLLISAENNRVVLRLQQRGHRVKARLYGDVKASTLYHVLKAPWIWFVEAFNEPQACLFGKNSCKAVSDIVEKESNEKLDDKYDDDLVLRLDSSFKGSSLGSAPRQTFPLVAVLFFEALQCFLVLPLHIKDDLMPQLSTQILCCYYKTEQFCVHLEKLFVSENCVVCNENEAQVVLLPCRHLALCRSCSKKVLVHKGEKCPMCRSAVQEYFYTDEEALEEIQS